MKFNLFPKNKSKSTPPSFPIPGRPEEELASPESFPPDETMEKTNNPSVRDILRTLGEGGKNTVSEFSKDLMRQSFTENPDFSVQENSLTYGDAESLRDYSGRLHERINSYLRGYWDCERLGAKTDSVVLEIRETIDKITNTIEKLPKLNENIITFRGTNLRNFRGYGVESLDDLNNLEGELFYEPAFTSTSTEREKSFYKKDGLSKNELPNNIEMEIYIPSGSRDGVPLKNKETSYYADDETEYLIGQASLFRIMKVETTDSSAKLKMALIPKELIPKELWAN